MMRTGIEIIEDVPGAGAPVARHNWYQIRLKLWLHRGEPVRWKKVWGTSPALLSDNGETLITHVRIDREQLFAGLFYGCEGMRVGGKRVLRIAPHLAYREHGVPGVIPANAILKAQLEFIGEGFPA